MSRRPPTDQEVASIAPVFILLDQVAMSLVHSDEPLRRGAKNHRVLATPAMRIAMVVLFTEQQHAALAHEFHDHIIRIEHTLAGEVLHLRRESPGVVDRAIDLQTVTLADDEVVVTVTRRRVYTASSRLCCRPASSRLH